MVKQVANFEVVRSKTGWYIVKQVYADGGKLIVEAAQQAEENARAWIADYCKKWGFVVGEIAFV